jgi:hypothetical protein
MKHGEKKQLLTCKICGSRFSETRNTIFFNSHYDGDTIGRIIRSVAEGNGIRETSRILGLSKDSVNPVVIKAGEYAEQVMSNLLKNLNLTECQMDELWSFINKKTLSESDIEREYEYSNLFYLVAYNMKKDIDWLAFLL